jgi:hypothetical protein
MKAQSELEYKIKQALGKFTELSVVRIQGFNTDIDNNDYADIWGPSVGRRTDMSVAQTLTIDGNSGQDDPGGAGINRLRIEGYDASNVYQSEELDSPGNGTVVTALTYGWFWKMTAIETGSDGWARRDIDIYPTIDGAGAIQGRIEADTKESHNSHFKVPAGHMGVFLGISHINLEDPIDDIDIWVETRAGDGDEWEVQKQIWYRQGAPNIQMMGGEEMFISLPELSEIKISAVGRAGNIDVYVDYNVLLEDCR